MTAPQPSNSWTDVTGEHRAVVSEATEVGYVRSMRATSEDADIPSDVPRDELWLWRNRRELSKTLRARDQLGQGQRVYKGDFTQFAKDDTG